MNIFKTKYFISFVGFQEGKRLEYDGVYNLKSYMPFARMTEQKLSCVRETIKQELKLESIVFKNITKL